MNLTRGNKSKKKVIIVGAGPGGLTTAMILAKRGFDVTIYEKNAVVGGRNASISMQGYTFDIGPTFLMMKFILDEVFEEAGTSTSALLDMKKMDPMYRLVFSDKTFEPTSDHAIMKKRIGLLFGSDAVKGYEHLLDNEKKRYTAMYPCLQKEYSSVFTLLHRDFLNAIPHLSLTKSMHDVLAQYFKNEDLRISFTFQSKYLGMSPWECPAAFMIIPFIEHQFGIYHPIGGLSKISDAMAVVAKRNGATIKLSTPVSQVLLDGKKAIGVELKSGKKEYADFVVLNADFGYAMEHLIPEGVLCKYTKPKLAKKKFSCSTFMMYLAVDKLYKVPHHEIIFSRDYASFIQNVAHSTTPLDDISLYVRNASITDPTLAPKGKSGLYILVPVQNNRAKLNWNKLVPRFKKMVYDILEKRGGYTELRKHVIDERVITPDTWEREMNVHIGATFNLAHSIDQMLHLRPHNRFEELDNCFLVGGGTHPGSGLPTIYESGRITANLISKDAKVEFTTKNLHVQ